MLASDRTFELSNSETMQAVTITQITPEELKNIITSSIKSLISEKKQDKGQSERLNLLTRNEASELLKIDISTLYHWTKKGTIQSYGIGNRVYYRLEDIKNALIKL